jgi:hypothetical protein
LLIGDDVMVMMRNCVAAVLPSCEGGDFIYSQIPPTHHYTFYCDDVMAGDFAAAADADDDAIFGRS